VYNNLLRFSNEFFITVQNSKTNSGFAKDYGQHSRLLESLVNFFGCGYVVKYEKREVCEFIVF